MINTLIKTLCDRCNNAFPEEDLIEFDGDVLCSTCLENDTVVCSHCEERIWQDDNCGSDFTPLCSHCFENHYCRCTDCHTLLHTDNARYFSRSDSPYCSECYADRESEDEDNFEFINPYCHKPDPIFRGSGIFYGIELEIDQGGMVDDNAYDLLHIGNRERENIYIKQDGSLEDGFEIVTHPMSLSYHQDSMPWQELLKKAIDLGYKSHQAETCGLHCHVSRAALGNTYTMQEKTISNILYFIEVNWYQMLKFSRRTEDQMNRWASRYGYRDNPQELLEHAKCHTIGRYACVNLSNSATIEIRMFRGTLRYNSLIATLQMVDQICNVCMALSNDEIKKLSWQDFVLGICKETKPELIEYLKIRQLYVNEPAENNGEEI